MPNGKILKQGLLSAGLATIYVGLVSAFMAHAEKIFGGKEPGPLGPVVFLLLFVVSAAVMGLLIFGRPIMMYIDGKKREAVELLISTIAFLAAITVLLLITLTMTNY